MLSYAEIQIFTPSAARPYSTLTRDTTAKRRYSLFFCLLLVIQGCATPSAKYLDTAAQLGLSNRLLTGSTYLHRLFINPQAERSQTTPEMHLYLDGDGTPWSRGVIVADDPTPRNPMVARMMAKDPSPSVLLGRPCYYGLSASPGCNPSLWTSHRYAADVVASMEAAIRRWLSDRTIDKLVLIGFSGGGTLATLLASRLKQTTEVVTIAANLDTEAWCQHHGYAPLKASLNPIHDAQISSNIRQYHLAGLEDHNVPAEIIEAFSRTQQNAMYLPMPEYDHGCCWLDDWPELLTTRLAR